MFSFNQKENRQKAKWLILIITICILIYLGIRYIGIVASSIWWFTNLIMPILLGLILALILDMPLSFFENTLFTKKLHLKSNTLKRNLSILLSFITVLGILILALFLVIPELIQAVITLIDIGTKSLQDFSQFEESMDYSVLPFGKYIKTLNIDWNTVIEKLESLLPTLFTKISATLPTALGSSVGVFVDVFLGIIFSIYILANKEKFIEQSKHLLAVWLPEKTNHVLLHIGHVCADSLRNFISGQTIEAIILGSLCALGMAILQLPYAPTIGILVGVTAFIPYVGAYIGIIIGFIMILTIHPLKAVVFVVFLVILQQVEGNVIYPKVVGSRINLPSFWVLAGLTVGGNLAGPIGMILGVPAGAALYTLLNDITLWKENQNKIKSKTECSEDIKHE